MSASIKTWISVAGALAISGCIYAEPSKSFNNSDICAILQLTIDLPNLQQYFHVSESPDGKPLKMVINDDFDKNCINLKKSNMEIELGMGIFAYFNFTTSLTLSAHSSAV